MSKLHFSLPSTVATKMLLHIIFAVSVVASLFAGAPVFEDGQALAQEKTPTYPDPGVEARTARELLALEAKIRTPYRGSNADQFVVSTAIALARLGRLEAALQVVGHIQILDADASNGAPQTRAEVLRLVVRRRCVVGNLAGAKQLIPSIKVRALRADSLLALARAYLRRGDLVGARQTLHQVSPLVQNRINATAYTAYLLARSDDLEGAKRLFARAQAKLRPVKESKRPGNSEKKNKSAEFEQEWKDHEARYEREYVARYLVKAGLADEALRMGTQHPFSHANLINDLMQANRFDIVLRLTREQGGYREVSNLIYTAITLDRHKRDRNTSLKLLAEAEAAYRALPMETASSGSTGSGSTNKKPAQQRRTRGDAEMRPTMLIFLAYAYRELGQPEKAQQWLQEALAGLSPGRAAALRALGAILPLLMAQESRTPLSLTRLKQIDAEITPELSLLYDPKEGYNLLRWLVEAQIKAGLLDAARDQLPRLEKFALSLIPGARDINDFSSALAVAKQWRQVGDEAQAQRLTQAIYDAPKATKVTKRSRARALLYNGFIEEGLARLAALGPSSSDTHHYPQIAYWQAKYRPHVFPERIVQIKSPRERLQELADFAQGLTEPIFESREERELVLSPSGYSSG